MSRLQRFHGHAPGVAVVALLLAVPAQAQLNTATVKGQIKSGEASVPAGLTVVAVNRETGFTYKTTTAADGTYALPGLPPGEYEIRVTDQAGAATKSEPITLAVGETASIDLAMARAEAAESITVTGSRQRKSVKTSEVGTNVSPKMIEALPQATRNFLSSVDLAPGVVFQQDSAGNTSIQAGAQNHDNVNVFIDGVSQKNNILRGGLTGQDSSRGNPFPQSAVQEYKVVTQNYKAEYDQVSSAAITAVTKSGTNDLHGEVYYDRTGTNLRAMTPQEIQKEAQGQGLMPSNQNQFGVSVGGPIQKDTVQFFAAYDGKYINDSRQVVPKNLDKLPPNTGVVPILSRQGGSYTDSFTEHLFFGKLDARLSDDQKLAISTKVRRETDHIPEDLNLSAPGNDKQKNNDEFRLDAVLDWNVGENWVSQSRAGWQSATWNPHPNQNAPEIRYKVSTGPQKVDAGQDVILMGGSPDNQKRGQSGFTLSQDMTNRGFENHLFKGGAKVSFLQYDLTGTSRSVDVVSTLVDPTTGLPFYDPIGGSCTGSNVINGGNNSDQCKIDRALASTPVDIHNTQVGLYVQDDWDVFSKLQLNLGVRWDVETNMLNNSYATPGDRVAVLNGPDTRTFSGQTAAPGQTYAQSLAKGGINIADYIADGSSRKTYLGAFAPRAGFAYDVLGNRDTVLFGGYGRTYDRTMANNALDEKQKNAQANGGEIWLIRNDFKMPYTDQFSVGIRQAVLMLNVEVAAVEQDGKNQFQWFSGNRDLNGGYATQSTVDPLWGGPAGYSQLILGDFIGETRTRQLLVQVVKPYTRDSAWNVTLAYTFSDAKTKHQQWNDDLFDWTYGRSSADRPWNTSRLVDKHRFVLAAMSDKLPGDVMLSGKLTLGSGLPRRIVGCPSSNPNPCDISNGGAVAFEGVTTPFKQIDLSLQKRFGVGPGGFMIRADMLNVFNWDNVVRDGNPWGGVYAASGGNRYGLDNKNVDDATGVRGPMRTVKLSASYAF